MTLDQELTTFARMKGDLLKTYDGKFALINAEEFCGAFDTAENAYAEGVKRFGQAPFLVKKISAQEEIYRNQALSLGLMHASV